MSVRNTWQVGEMILKSKDVKSEDEVDLSGIDPDELEAGIKVEEEHNEGDTDVVRSRSDLTKIAVAHLREDPKYYTKLRKVGL